MKNVYSIVLAVFFAAQPVMAYDTGAMTCDDIGKFAATLMSDREKGQKKEEALETVNHQEWTGDVEKGNMIVIVNLIHGRVGNQLADAKAAYGIIRRDCEFGQPRQR